VDQIALKLDRNELRWGRNQNSGEDSGKKRRE